MIVDEPEVGVESNNSHGAKTTVDQINLLKFAAVFALIIAVLLVVDQLL